MRFVRPENICVLVLNFLNRLCFMTPQMSKKKSRCRVCEYWIQVAHACLQIRNFNSLMAILAGLNIRPVARLKKTVRARVEQKINIINAANDKHKRELWAHFPSR